MRTPKKIEASRRNGARSLGPVTPRGKFRSVPLARTVVLESEAEDRFLALLAGFMKELLVP